MKKLFVLGALALATSKSEAKIAYVNMDEFANKSQAYSDFEANLRSKELALMNADQELQNFLNQRRQITRGELMKQNVTDENSAAALIAKAQIENDARPYQEIRNKALIDRANAQEKLGKEFEVNFRKACQAVCEAQKFEAVLRYQANDQNILAIGKEAVDATGHVASKLEEIVSQQNSVLAAEKKDDKSSLNSLVFNSKKTEVASNEASDAKKTA